MFIIPGLFMLFNSLLTHNILTSYSTTYKTLTFRDKNEVVGRVNCSLYQFYILYRCLTVNDYDGYIQTNQTFTSFIFFDLLHYFLYSNMISSYLHHIITILVVLFINSEYSDYNKVVIFNHLLFIFESTNPPMSISWIANKFGYNNYKLFKIFATFTFINWSVMRIFYTSYYIYSTPSFENKVLLMPFFGLNLFWFKALVNVYLKVLKK